MQKMKVQLKSGFTTLALGGLIFSGFSMYSGSEKFYHQVVMPCAHLLDPETAHVLGIKMARFGLFPRRNNAQFPNLSTQVFGLNFPHPIGLAAGFDKQGEAVCGLLDAGFAFVEIGSVTPQPQSGNPQPRVFRLTEDQSIINRYGFNSDGHDAVYERLKSRSWEGKGVVGINLGQNKCSLDPAGDFVAGVKRFGEIADYLVINVSSPNTPGLRNLQKTEALEKMLTRVLAARNSLTKKTPLLLKISPDESDEDIQNIVKVIQSPKCRVDGLIISNTTVSRPLSLSSPHAKETGGLSGPHLQDPSTRLIQRVHSLTAGSLPIIGVGGVSSAQDVSDKLAAGASLVQLYTALAFQGPMIGHKLASQLNNSCPVKSSSKPSTLRQTSPS